MSRPAGQRPKPTELKILEGNPGKRALKERPKGAIPATVPDPPPDLKAYGRSRWRNYWQSGRAWLAESDIEALAQLCRYHDEEHDLMRQIRREGFTQISDDTGRSFVHRLYNDVRGVRSNIRFLWGLLFMTPSDRARASVKPEKGDELDAWAADG